MEINLEEGVATFHINETGNVTRQTYMGTFKVHCVLSPVAFIEADREYREMLGSASPQTAHEHARSIAFALSQLKHRIIEEPPFWENRRLGGSHIKDDNIIVMVLNLSIEAEEKYREMKQKEAEEIQERLTNMIKKNEIEKEPEVDKIDVNDTEEMEKLQKEDEEDGVDL